LLEIIPAESIGADCTVVPATESAAVPSTLLSLLLSLTLALGILLPAESAWAYLPPGNAITDPAALLRDALPVQQPDLEDLQHRLEATSEDLRARRWSGLRSSCGRTQQQLAQHQEAIVAALPQQRQGQASDTLGQLKGQLEQLCTAADQQDRDGFLSLRRQALASIGASEALFVEDFPFQIPEEFQALPRLLGRATVQLSTNKGDLTLVVDGYNAPLTAGAFVDLVQRGFYDGLGFNRAEDFYVLQTGDPKGPETGFVAPGSKSVRPVPLEIRAPGITAPYYNETFEELGLFKTTPVLPFAAKGTLGWAHSDAALDDGSSQFFLFLFEPELTPSGLNLIDGRYAAFGYVVDGFDVLGELTVDDRIVSAKVLNGAEQLQPHG